MSSQLLIIVLCTLFLAVQVTILTIFNVHAYVDTILFILVVETHPLVNSLESVYVSMNTELLNIHRFLFFILENQCC